MKYEGKADVLMQLITIRTGLKNDELVCPREKSDMTPCVARDGDCAMTEDGKCAGCGADVAELLVEEMKKHLK